MIFLLHNDKSTSAPKLMPPIYFDGHRDNNNAIEFSAKKYYFPTVTFLQEPACLFCKRVAYVLPQYQMLVGWQ